MAVRWQFLSDSEKRKLEEYDDQLVSLLTQRRNESTEAELKLLHSKLDRFIDLLCKKYDDQ